MPTLTTVAWERLIEPRSDGGGDKTDKTAAVSEARVPPCHIYISPSLYTTPASAPIPYTDPPSPSPYVVNHKRRGRVDRLELVEREKEEEVREREEREVKGEGEGDDVAFLEARGDDVSSVEGGERSIVSDFFDADEEFFSDGSTPRVSSYGKKLESELLTTKLNLFVEIEKRKSAEEILQQMYTQWQRLGNLLSQNQSTIPPPTNSIPTHVDIEALQQLSQEIVFTRFFDEEIEKIEARAEAELDLEAILQSKDQEISRLRDRLRYYEAVNHEMCQRNQEVMEVARKQRQRKQTRRRWLWSCLGISVTVGSSLMAYSFVPLVNPSDPANASGITSE